jgi:hypothetical protein
MLLPPPSPRKNRYEFIVGLGLHFVVDINCQSFLLDRVPDLVEKACFADSAISYDESVLHSKSLHL